MVASPSPAPGAVVIGQTGVPTGFCGVTQDWAQLTVSTGPQYVVPTLPGASALRITSWSHLAHANAGQTLKFKIYRQVSGLTYMVVAQDVRALTSGVLNTFAVNIPVRTGDVLGITTAPGSPMTGCGHGPFTETDLLSNSDASPGQLVTFMNNGGARLNISAVVEPTNTFTIGKTALNRKNGTAKLTLTVPNAGELAVAGTGVAEAAGLRANPAKSVPAGTVQLTIKATGKKRKKLKRKGKAAVAPTITYTPTGGTATTQSTSLKLRKKRKKRKK